MRNLLTDPLWQPQELGKPIPDSPHAVSVCLPRWADNVGYEEQQPRVIKAMQSGYPRFFYHPLCRSLFAECRRRLARGDEECLVFPSRRTAEQFQSFLQGQADVATRIVPFGREDVFVVLFPPASAETARLGWQHLGLGLSSRQAESLLEQRRCAPAEQARQTLRGRIAQFVQASADDVYLFPSGMNALFNVHLALQRLGAGRKSVQFGFPYVDTLKILQKIGPGTHFFPRGDATELNRLRELVRREPLAGLYTEFPSNPLLKTPDLAALRDVSLRGGFPLVVDETIAGFYNVDLLEAADVLVSSLTKSFSGIGDVAAGSIVLSAGGPFYADLKSALEALYEDTLFAEDARVLEANSRDYADRMPRINRTAERLIAFLRRRPEIAALYDPSLHDVSCYDRYRRPEGGYGGLFSLVLKEAPQRTAGFFDRLRLCKGPNLGANYTLACPFTILAHYRELEFAESCGVSRWLIRVSVGLEEPVDLIERFREALEAG